MKHLSGLLKLESPLILASQSPRRKKLLGQLGISFSIIPSDFDENSVSFSGNPAEHVKMLALMKAKNVCSKIDYEAIVIGSDTIVVIDNLVLNKPADKEDAFRMLRLLSGRTHTVFTGITIINSKSSCQISEAKSTEVTFRDLSDDEISAYIETGSPLDKAGSYGIQDDFGAVFVSNVNGCYYNIVGLPLEMLYSSLKKFLMEQK